MAEVVDHGPTEVSARLELIEDRAQLRQRADARDVALHPTVRREVDEVSHVLHRADRRIHDRRVLHEELERVELDVALARRGQADGDEQATRSQQVESEPEPSHLRREHQAGVDAAELAPHDVDGFVGTDRHVRAQRRDEVETFLADVDPERLDDSDGHGPVWVAITPDGKHAYVSNAFDGTVSVITTATGAVSAPITVGTLPIGVAITPDGKHAYVSNATDGTVSVITTATGAVSAPITVGHSPGDVAITPNGKQVYVANYADTIVSVITTATGAVAPITVGKDPDAVAICPARNAHRRR